MSTYDESLEPHCKYCGTKLDGIRNHLQGSIPSFCRYTNCRSQWSSFKAKVSKLKDSVDPTLKELALYTEKSVFDEGKYAKWWHVQLKLHTRKKNLPMIVK